MNPTRRARSDQVRPAPGSRRLSHREALGGLSETQPGEKARLSGQTDYWPKRPGCLVVSTYDSGWVQGRPAPSMSGHLGGRNHRGVHAQG